MVIHTALQNYEGVTTSSTGVEPNRRVVVSYVKPDKSDNKPQSREWADSFSNFMCPAHRR